MACCTSPRSVILDDQEVTREAHMSLELLQGGGFGGNIPKTGLRGWGFSPGAASRRNVEHPAGPVTAASYVDHEVQTELLICQLLPSMA